MGNSIRNNQAVQGYSEYFRINPTEIKVQASFNPRENFNEEKLEELKESIIENGVMVPLRVKLNADNQFIYYFKDYLCFFLSVQCHKFAYHSLFLSFFILK